MGIFIQEGNNLEPYRAYGRGSYNRNMNSGCNQMKNMGNQNRTMCNQNRPSCNQDVPVCNQENMIMSMINNKDCGCQDNCQDGNPHMRHFQLGMGYVPMQEWGDLYDLEVGYCQGTIFPDLNFVFCGARGKM